MDTLVTIVAFLAVLIVLVLAHECGHFFTARAAGVRIEEFGIGFPPRLFSFMRRGIRYSLNVVPLGGFVKLAGEEDPGVPGSLAGKSAAVRVVVLASGSIMNAILPVLLFTVAFMVPHTVAMGQVLVENVAGGSPAAQAGMVTGDAILAIDGRAVHNIGDVQRRTQLHLGQETEILVQHADDTQETVTLVPRWRPPAGQGAMGVTVGLDEAEMVRLSEPVWRAVPLGVRECYETYILFKNVIISMFVGTAPAVVGGPVAIAQISGDAARAGFSYLLEFAAFFSINLAIINIFPLPALDGGRIAFVVLEWLRRGKRVSARVEGIVHSVGFFALIALMIAITYQDILRIITGGSLVP